MTGPGITAIKIEENIKKWELFGEEKQALSAYSV